MQNVRLAIRALRATPIVSSVAILSLALGIGASTAIFSLLDSLALRTLPVSQPDRLVQVSAGTGSNAYSYAVYDEIRQRRLFDGGLAWAASRLTIDREPRTIFSLWVSGDFFATLRVPPILGRRLNAADDREDSGPDGPVAMISHRLWQRRFGGAHDVIGRSLIVERVPVTIVGVAPREFSGVEVGYAFDLFLPVSLTPLIRPSIPYDRHTAWLRMMLRLRSDQSIQAATAALRGAQPQIRHASVPPGSSIDEFLEEPFVLEPASRGTSALRDTYQRPLVTLLALVMLVLFVACANLANLFLARAAARREELSLRRALGASHVQLVRQLLVESFLLAAVAAAVGLMFAGWMSRALVAQVSAADSPIALSLSLNWRVMSFAVGAATLAALLCGLWPAFRATRIAPMDALKGASRGGASDHRMRAFDVVLIAQVAISLLLMVAAGLLVRSAQQLARASLGFDHEQVLTAMITAPTIPAADRNAFYHRLVDTVAAVPGVQRVGGSLDAPLTRRSPGVPVTVIGATSAPQSETSTQFIAVTPAWLSTYGIPIRRGRDLDRRDIVGALPVMLVNEAFVRRFFPEQSIVGRTLEIVANVPPTGRTALPPRAVVGVVGDAVYSSIREPVPPTVYTPLAQRDRPVMLSVFFMAVRPTVGPPAQMADRVGAALRGIDPDVRLLFRPASEQVEELLAPDRLVATLSTFAGGLALLLALLGMYGLTAYAVARRRAEIGLRLALGSAPANVVWLVLSRMLTLVGVGIAVGSVASVWASTLLAPLLYGLEPDDPLTLAGAVLLIGAAAVMAGWSPAWRASRVNPIQAIKEL